MHKHQANRPATDHGHSVADLDSGLVESTQHAGQRLDHGCFFKTHMRWNDQSVQINNATRNTNIFGVSAVVEQQVFAKIFLVARAIEAGLAGSGIQRDYAHAFFESANTRTNVFDGASEFVTEEGWGHDHSRVIPALIDLEIGAAGERDLDFDEELAIAHVGDGNLLDLHVLFAVEDGCGHLASHCCPFCEG